MAIIADVLTGLFLLGGCAFILIGGLGILRMPELFTRLHAAGVLDTMGAGLILIGLMFQSGFSQVTLKLVLVLVSLLITSPVASHALAKAALHGGRRPLVSETIDLDESKKDD
ncbi:MAG: monovalent cation/H(+) antiporter subunit G [Gammaproteobacteria bacterium]|nr:monovalent cation/H(+) antiporter subunit G [Gammaproteobacteria bacterium]